MTRRETDCFSFARCALNDMNCRAGQPEQTASLQDMNAANEQPDMACSITNMNCRKD